VLAGIVVVVGGLTSGEMVSTIAIALAFFVLATGYSWWRFRRRLQEQGTGSR